MFTVKVIGIERVQEYLTKVQQGLKGKVLRWVAEYIVGNGTHGLKHYPYYKYINRFAGFPNLGFFTKNGVYMPGWKSEKQWRYVMAMIREGRILPGYPRRTGNMQRAWEIRDQAATLTIWNNTPYAKWVMGNYSQTRMHSLIGWRRTTEVIRTNLSGAIAYAKRELDKWLKKPSS